METRSLFYRKPLEDSEELNAIRAYDLAISEEEEIPFEAAIAEIPSSSHDRFSRCQARPHV